MKVEFFIVAGFIIVFAVNFVVLEKWAKEQREKKKGKVDKTSKPL